MQWKLVSAFSTGAVLASGIVYFAVKPQDAVQQPIATQGVAPPRPAQVPAAVPAPETVMPPANRIAVREKPSPMPASVHRQQTVEIARVEPPPVSATPAPQTTEPAPPPEPAAPTPPPVSAPVPPPVSEPAPAPVQAPVQNVVAPVPAPQARMPHTVTLTAGTLLAVRIGETISTAHNQAGDSFLATLTRPLVIDGWIIADRGERVEGRVIESRQPGRGGGDSQLAISLVRLATDDRQNIPIRTEPYTKHGASAAGTDAAKIGAGAAIGAVIGAIAGGGKGAAIGAGAGGAIGAGDVLLTRGRPAEIPVETLITFRVQDSITITEHLD
ncbi:MAG TPA: hypothetical protein VME17_20490 [Bryobacteraceae bacterium]|nr:hypothetical protein [Bryobacteraceae bacterium]